MSIVLKELRINGSNIVDENTSVNEIVFDVSSGISTALKEDIIAIEKNYPKLLKRITIRNTGTRTGEVQNLISILTNFDNLPGNGPTKSALKIKELEIESGENGDFIMNSANFKALNLGHMNLRYTKPGDFARIQVIGPGIKLEKISLSGFDLSSLDMNLVKCQDLGINDRYANLNQIKNAKRLVRISTKKLDKLPIRNVLDYVKANKNIAAFEIEDIDLSSIDIFRELKESEVIDLVLNNNNLKSLRGADQLYFTALKVYNNDIGINDIPTINKCIAKNPNIETYFHVGNKRLIDGLTALQGGQKLSELTLQRIRERWFLDSDFEVTDPLRYLMCPPMVSYSIKDAETIRGKANLIHNPIEFDSDLDIETFDFEKDYLKGGTLLLTVEQTEKLAKSGRKIPMKIGIGIENASELSVEKLEELVKSIGVSEVRMVGTDGEYTAKYPYTTAQYRIAREKLDEIVSGIDPKESDLDKFATIYTRLAHMAYDYKAVNQGNKSEILESNKRIFDARTLVNGLRDGNTCVCSGYTEILRNAAALVGIKTRYIIGKSNDSPHAWTEVELADENGKKNKYWADLTWDNMENWRGEKRKSPYDFKWFLIDEKTFREKHETYKNKGIIKNHEAYNREKVKEAIEKARKRDIYRKNEKALIADPKPILKPDPKPDPKPNPKPNPKPDPKPDPKPVIGGNRTAESISKLLSEIDELVKECENVYSDSVAKNPDTVGYPNPQPLVFRDGLNKPQDLSKPVPPKKDSSKEPSTSNPKSRSIDDDDEER
ncbi:MAG: hypothetical protein K6D97_06550 [Clostridia bacterium]|nr:hypothetical protein [Clostridia bacterium]